MPELHDFQDSRGPVPAHRHFNGGGWVEDTAVVGVSAHVGPEACVYGGACVLGDAVVLDQARVSEKAVVAGRACVRGRARVAGKAIIEDGALVEGNARVLATARIGGTAVVTGDSFISYDALIRAPVNHAWGRLLDYSWDAYTEKSGRVLLRYGCHTRTPDSWVEYLPFALREWWYLYPKEYDRAIRALAEFVKAFVKPGDLERGACSGCPD